MSDRDFEYFKRRERDERACAERAKDQSARRAHLTMADRYAARLRATASPVSMPSQA